MECILRRQRSNTIYRYTLPAQKSTFFIFYLCGEMELRGVVKKGSHHGKGKGVGEGRRAPVIEGRAKGSYMYMYLPIWLQTWDFPN